ncbi:MAG: sulfite exporter TauE/SafE family protein [Bacillota bacterium]
MVTTILAYFLVAILAGIIGSMLGLGGGIIIVPALTLLFGVEIHTAVAASVVSVIATSMGASLRYLKEGLINTRVAMLLQVGATLGAVSGAVVEGLLDPHILYLMFGGLMAYSAYSMYQARRLELPQNVEPDAVSRRLALQGSYYDQALGRVVDYQITRTLPGLAVMYLSGAISGLLGIGGGAFKVLAMDQVMRMPIKVSSATSAYMIGVTAAAGSIVYLLRGDVVPQIAGPVALGVLAGAMLGTLLMVRMRGSTLRKLFIPVLLVIAVQMLVKGVGG